MSDVDWLLKHSEEADASPEFAWDFWTDVSNWDDPPAQFVLEGPFAEGSRGVTRLPDREPVQWTICEVRPGNSFTTETQLDEATLRCQWSFEPLAEGRTRLTQRLGLSGKKSAGRAEGVRAAFGPTLPEGMKRIAKLIAEAEKRAGSRAKPPSRKDQDPKGKGFAPSS